MNLCLTYPSRYDQLPTGRLAQLNLEVCLRILLASSKFYVPLQICSGAVRSCRPPPIGGTVCCQANDEMQIKSLPRLPRISIQRPDVAVAQKMGCCGSGLSREAALLYDVRSPRKRSYSLAAVAQVL